MPISGLVLTFEHASEDRLATIDQLRAHPEIEVGAHDEYKCAIVVASESPDEDKKISQWVHNLPGVADVQITFIGFDEPDAETDST